MANRKTSKSSAKTTDESQAPDTDQPDAPQSDTAPAVDEAEYQRVLEENDNLKQQLADNEQQLADQQAAIDAYEAQAPADIDAAPGQQRETRNGEILLRLTKDAVLGNGTRKRGECLGSCHVNPEIGAADVFAAISDPRWTREVPHESGQGVLIVMAGDHGDYSAGDALCYIVPDTKTADGQPADYTVRECVNVLRNPHLLGR